MLTQLLTQLQILQWLIALTLIQLLLIQLLLTLLSNQRTNRKREKLTVGLSSYGFLVYGDVSNSELQLP